MNRDVRLGRRLAGTGLSSAAAAALAVLAGVPVLEAAVGAGLAWAALVAVVAVPPRTGGTPWGRPSPAERTSAGWHEVRLLADSMARAGRDPGARSAVSPRVLQALGRPGGGATLSRREYEGALRSVVQAAARLGGPRPTEEVRR